METWKDRLKSAADEMDLKAPDIADRLTPKLKAPSVYAWFSKKPGSIQELTGPNLIKVCELLRIQPKWLITGKGPRRMLPPVYDVLLSLYNDADDDNRKVMDISLDMACRIALQSLGIEVADIHSPKTTKGDNVGTAKQRRKKNNKPL